MHNNSHRFLGVLFSTLMLGSQCLPLQAQEDGAGSIEYEKGNYDADTKGDLDAAIADYSKAIELNPQYANAYYSRGRAKAKKGDLDGAIADYDQAIKLNPRGNEAEVYYVERSVAKKQKGDLKGADEDSNQAESLASAEEMPDADRDITHNPNFAPAYEHRGFLKMSGDLDGAIADFSHAIELSPKNDSYYTDRGKAKHKKGDLDGAIVDYEQALALNGESPLFNQGEAEDKNASDRVIAGCSLRIADNPKSAINYCNRGRAKADEGDFDGAIADFSQAIALHPNVEGFYTDRGEAKDKKGDVDGAIADDNQAIALDPKDADSYISRGEVKLHRADFDGAIADFSQAIALNPSYTLERAYDDRGLAKHKKGDLAGAIADYEQAHAPHPVVPAPNEGPDIEIADANRQIELHPNDAYNNADAYSKRGMAKERKGDLAGAIADYSQAIALDPKNVYLSNAYYYSWRGEVKDKQGDLAGAIADFSQAIILDPKKIDLYIDRGREKDKNGDMDGAIADFSQAIALKPKGAGAYGWRGRVKRQNGDLDGAIEDYNQAIALDPNWPRYYCDRGNAKETKGDMDGAIADYSQAIALGDSLFIDDAYAYRGRTKAAKGDWDGAIADCNKALELSLGSSSIAYYSRGIAKDRKGDHEGAVDDYNQAISLERLERGQKGNSSSRSPSEQPGPPSFQPGTEKKVALGTGFFVTSTGYLLSDFHVVKDASSIKVKMGNSIASASLVAKDAANDIALLKIDGTHACLPLGDSSAAPLGQTVFTIGFPEPELQGLSPKLTKGEISSLAGMQDDPRMFQVSVQVQPGNSGGCLVDESGNVVGLIEATLSTVETAKSSGDLLQNVNYATKINYAKVLLDTVPDAKSGLMPLKTTPAPFTDQVKSVEDATVFIIAGS